MKLSIIIPAYKVEAYIGKCLYSVENQDLPSSEYEVLVIDDGSPDNSKEVATRIANDFDNIKVISQPNGGLSAARNTGIENSIGEYIMFLDSDDWIASNCLKLITDKCYNENLDLLEICAADVCNDVAKRRFSHTEHNVVTGVEALRRGIAICAPFVIYKRQLLIDNKISFYPGIYHEDNEFSPRVYHKAQRVGSINDIIYYVYQNPNSITRSANPKKAYDTLIVIKSLYDYMINNVSIEDQDCFKYQIVQDFNVCLSETFKMSKDDILKLDACIYEHRWILKYLQESCSLIYKIEGTIMKIFPKRYTFIYQMLNKLDWREKDFR